MLHVSGLQFWAEAIYEHLDVLMEYDSERRREEGLGAFLQNASIRTCNKSYESYITFGETVMWKEKVAKPAIESGTSLF